jgi:hypothetical protein
MAKAIRTITYEGTPEKLEGQMFHSLQEGVCDFVSSVKITVKTEYSDIDSEKFGAINRTQAIEDYTAPKRP